MPGMSTEHVMTDQIDQILHESVVKHDHVQALVICGSYALGTARYSGPDRKDFNSDLDFVILSDAPLRARRTRKEIYDRLAALGVPASASIRASYARYSKGRISVSLYEHDEIRSGVVVVREGNTGKTPQMYFCLRAELEVPLSEYIMLVINRHFELTASHGLNTDRAEQKLAAAITELVTRAGMEPTASPTVAVHRATRIVGGGFHERYYHPKRRLLWAIRTGRARGIPTNTLHLYAEYVNACPNEVAVLQVLEQYANEWRRGSA